MTQQTSKNFNFNTSSYVVLRLEVYKDINNYIGRHRERTDPFVLVLLLTFPSFTKDFRSTLESFEDTTTWWLQSGYSWYDQSIDKIISKIERGPLI